LRAAAGTRVKKIVVVRRGCLGAVVEDGGCGGDLEGAVDGRGNDGGGGQVLVRHLLHAHLSCLRPSTSCKLGKRD